MKELTNIYYSDKISLTDKFSNTIVNQARALTEIIDESKLYDMDDLGVDGVDGLDSAIQEDKEYLD
jgi:hypothetical protein